MVPLFSVSDPLSVKLTIFKIWQIPNLDTVFESELIWNFLKLLIFCHQLIWPNLLYFSNLEDSGNDVGDFFAYKVMQILNLETVFESGQIWNFFCHALPNLLFNVNYLGHLEELKVFKHTVLVTKWPSFRKMR